MNFLEEKIFHNKYLKEKKAVKKLARPVSLILTIAIVIGVVVLVMFIVIPELTKRCFRWGGRSGLLYRTPSASWKTV